MKINTKYEMGQKVYRVVNKQVGMYQEAYSKINSIIKNTGWIGSNDFNNNQSQMSSQTGAQNQASNASQSQQTANKKYENVVTSIQSIAYFMCGRFPKTGIRKDRTLMDNIRKGIKSLQEQNIISVLTQDGDNYVLDKDLLVQGNKVYSPETCVFLLHYQNTMFERSAKDKIYEKEDGTFVIGGGKKKTYATLKEAEDIVCERNQNRIESVAEKCKGSIPMCAYEAMLNWDVRLAMCS